MATCCAWVRNRSEGIPRGQLTVSARTDLPLLDRHVPIRIVRPYIFRPRPNQPVVVELLDHMRRPSADTRDRKDRREQVYVDAQRVIRRSRIEGHVGVQLLLRLHEALDLLRHVIPLRLTAGTPQITRPSAPMRGPLILPLINPMS